jgi:hypothetical protein
MNGLRSLRDDSYSSVLNMHGAGCFSFMYFWVDYVERSNAMKSGMYTDAGLSMEIGMPTSSVLKLNSALMQGNQALVVMVVKTSSSLCAYLSTTP